MERSIFLESDNMPDKMALIRALGECFPAWEQVTDYIIKHALQASDEWTFSKSGWNYRIRHNRRVIIYLMPCKGYFRASLILGKRGINEAKEALLSEPVRAAIDVAKTYAEGTGIRIDVKSEETLNDVKKLIDLKLKY